MNLRPYVLGLVLLAATGCAGTAAGMRTLAGESGRGVAYLPSDAFFAARLDVRAMREVPGWGAIEAVLTATRPLEGRGWLTTDVAYFAMGGLVDVALPPPAPPPADTLAEAGAGEVVPPATEPKWVELARGLGGRLPSVVITLEGREVSLCSQSLVDSEVREAQGFRIATEDGFSVAVAGDALCVMTFAPLIDGVLAARSATPRIVSRLTSDPALVGVAVELGSTGLREVIAALREQSGRGSNATAALADESEDTAAIRLAERVFGALGEGIEAIEWQLGRSGASFASRTRIYADDMDRGIMWRELTEMALAMIAAFGESGLGGIEASHAVDAISESTTVEEEDDGFVLVTRIADTTVTGIVEGLVSDESTDALDDPSYEDDGSASDLFDVPNLPAAERMVEIQTKLDAMLEATSHQRWPVVISLAEAYAHLGRFDDAARLLVRAETLAPEDERWEIRRAMIEIHIARGHVADALAVVDAAIAACATSYCPHGREHQALRSLVIAIRGDADALDAFDAAVSTDTGSSDDFIVMRARVLVARSNWAEAYPVLDALVAVSRSPEYQTRSLREAYVESLARSGQSLARVRAANARVFAADDAEGERRDEITTRLYYDCLARSLREPSEPTSRASCGEAATRATAEHGAAHPLTASAALEYARVLAAARDTAGARRELAKVDAALGAIGPAHPLHARRAALRVR